MRPLRCWHPEHSLQGLLDFVSASDDPPNPAHSAFNSLRACGLVVTRAGAPAAWSELAETLRQRPSAYASFLRAAAFRVPLFDFLVRRFGATSVPPDLFLAFVAAIGYPHGPPAANAVAWFVDVRCALADLDPGLCADIPLLDVALFPLPPWSTTDPLRTLPHAGMSLPPPTRDCVRGDGLCWRCGAGVGPIEAECLVCRRTLVLLARELQEARRLDRYLAHQVCMMCYAPIPAVSSAGEICCSSRCSSRKNRFLHYAPLTGLFSPAGVPTPLPLRPTAPEPFPRHSPAWSSLERAADSFTRRRVALGERFARFVAGAGGHVLELESRLADAGFDVTSVPALARTDPIFFQGVRVRTGPPRVGWRAVLPGAGVSLQVHPLCVRPAVHHPMSGGVPREHYPLWAFDMRVGGRVEAWRVVVEVSSDTLGAQLVRDPYRGLGACTPVDTVLSDFDAIVESLTSFLDLGEGVWPPQSTPVPGAERFA